MQFEQKQSKTNKQMFLYRDRNNVHHESRKDISTRMPSILSNYIYRNRESNIKQRSDQRSFLLLQNTENLVVELRSSLS